MQSLCYCARKSGENQMMASNCRTACMRPLCVAFRYSAIVFYKKRRKSYLIRAAEYLHQLHSTIVFKPLPTNTFALYIISSYPLYTLKRLRFYLITWCPNFIYDIKLGWVLNKHLKVAVLSSHISLLNKEFSSSGLKIHQCRLSL